jgi:hypothetical protein
MAKKKKVAPKKREVNKTQEVMKYLAAHRGAGPVEVSEALGKKGIDVTPAYVSTIKSKASKGKKTAGRKRRKTAATGGELSTKLAAAISVVESAGGIDEAKKALGTIRKLEG